MDRIKKILTDITVRKIKTTQNRKTRRLRKRGKDITNTVWWWIAKNIEDKKKLGLVCFKIADFYNDKPAALIGLQISDMVVLNDTVFIFLGRPGLIIGKGGSTIDSLTAHINNDVNGNKVDNYNIDLIEDLSSWKHLINRSFARLNYLW